MYKKILILFLFSVTMMSCSSSKKVTSNTSKKYTTADKIVWTAVSYKGTPYKYGGASSKGMDCSGLIYTAFNHRNILLPRTSKEMAKQGKRISLREVRRGDLLFFQTGKNRNSVNHVGLVTSVANAEIFFIHSSSSRGVIVTSLHNSYWKKNFVKAKRVL